MLPPRAQTSATIALTVLGRENPCSPSLSPQSMPWGSSPSSASMQTGWWYCPIGDLLRFGAGLLRRLDLGAHAARRGEGRLFRERFQLRLQVEGCIILVGASCWPPDFLQSCEQLARFQDLEASFAEPDEPEARAVGLSKGRCRAPPEVVAIPEVPLRLELLVLLAPADLIGHISGLLRERDALEGSSSACAWQAELSAYSFGL